jgi:hypothetical protein
MSSLYNLHCGRRRRRRRLSLLVIIEGDPVNTQHKEEKGDEDELLFRLPLHNHTSPPRLQLARVVDALLCHGASLVTCPEKLYSRA